MAVAGVAEAVEAVKGVAVVAAPTLVVVEVVEEVMAGVAVRDVVGVVVERMAGGGVKGGEVLTEVAAVKVAPETRAAKVRTAGAP